MAKNPKHKALSEAAKGEKFSHHDLKTNTHREVPYSEVRSSIKKSYGKKASRYVREKILHNLKPGTSEAIPSHGGYYSRTK